MMRMCPEYSELRNGLDLNKMDNLVTFFKKLLEQREKSEKNGSGRGQSQAGLLDS